MDLQSRGVPEEIQLGCPLDDFCLGNCVNMQISAAITETYMFSNIFATMHYIISKNLISSISGKLCIVIS